jgi:TusA-related sulfurtransferase
VDVRGAITPFSLLKVSLVFQQMRPSETLEIVGCDMEMQRDLLKLLPNASCEAVGTGSNAAAPEMQKVRLKKNQVTDSQLKGKGHP